MTALRIHLENHGQRFHTFTLRDGVICEANAQSWIWNGARVLNRTIASGTILQLTDATGSGVVMPIRWPVQAVFMAPDLPNAAPPLMDRGTTPARPLPPPGAAPGHGGEG